MAYTKNVLIEWNYVQGVNVLATVSIDEAWNSIEEEDPEIFWHFSSLEDYLEALKKPIDGTDWRIVREA